MRSDINIAKLVADDARAADGFRKDRNLSFQSNITEATLMAELVMVNFLKLKRLAKLHTELYVFTGIGAFTYNPQAKYEGVWYDLRPLGTEGQGLIPGTKEYGQIAGVIPMGFGIRKLLTSSLTLGMEMSFRKSFTDYIDDVSGRYYSQDQLRERRRQIAAELSDRRIGSSGSVGFRGNPNENDNYGFFQIYIYKGLSSQLILNEQQAFRKVSKKMYKCPKFL